DAALATEQWTEADRSLRELIEKSSGQPASREALLRSGLLNYRKGNYTEAATDLERLLALPQAENNELTARYWLWRALQKSKSDRAARAADDVMTKFPFSYYGLRARIEQGKGTLEWDSTKAKAEKVESKIWVTANEKLAWEKVQMLLKAGWVEEAQAELKELPPALRAEDRAVRSLVWAAAAGFVTASRLANDGWDEKSDLRRAPFTDAAFPREFTDIITTQAAARNVDRDLVRSLIKQESSYNVKATSTSNAYGLMQMIPPTAREIAQDLKLGTLKLPEDMFVPERNIRMGTYYLSRMISKYQGNIPLSLAAYNAGPGRMDKWLRTRPTLKNLASLKSSKPDDELWIDELPYSEPCFYVKAILRNLMLYRLLDKGRVEITEPIWQFSQVKEGPKN
ncbi:MAG: lytic murein transglycosylase, partial [Proteobacteria bacterium]